jgi:hypothetical protein
MDLEQKLIILNRKYTCNLKSWTIIHINAGYYL